MERASAERPERASSPGETPAAADLALRCARLHLRIGWYCLLAFLSLGAVLEGMHLYQLEIYVSPAAETTRLMWRLAHVHGALIGIVHLAFGASVHLACAWSAARRRLASRCLLLAVVLLPGGFLLGGVLAADGDPSPGVLLVPAGAAALFVGVLLTARGVSHAPDAGGEPVADSPRIP